MKFYNKHILVGQADWYGNYHYDTLISCHENNRPMWFVEREEENGGLKIQKGMSLIPTNEHFMEDALILLAYDIDQNESFIQFMNKLLNTKKINRIDLYEDLTEDKRKLILSKLKTIEFNHELIFYEYTSRST